jgi:hypothetical protein
MRRDRGARHGTTSFAVRRTFFGIFRSNKDDKRPARVPMLRAGQICFHEHCIAPDLLTP